MCRYRFHVKIEKFTELEKKLETAEIFCAKNYSKMNFLTYPELLISLYEQTVLTSQVQTLQKYLLHYLI